MRNDPDPGAVLPRRESTRYRLPKNPEDVLPIVPTPPVAVPTPSLPRLEPTTASIAAVYSDSEPRVAIQVPTIDSVGRGQ